MDQQDKSGPSYTNGPWMKSCHTVYALNADGVNRFSATFQAGRNDDDERTSDAEVEACATLAAAAPELYEALKSCVAALDPYTDEAKEAYAALDKATGSQQ